VGPATNGFTLADTRSVKAVFGVPDTAVGRIKLGSPQMVRTDALPQTFSGHVTAISAAADPKSRVYSVEVRIDNPHNLLKSGMIASIAIGTPSAAGSVTVIPLSAVVRGPSNSGFAVFVAEGSGDIAKIHTQDVSLGETYGNDIAVRGGVSVNDRVVTSGTNLVKNGDQVRVIP
jgi:multidrug efflux system membrane fusion protein